MEGFFLFISNANLQSTPPGAISKCAKAAELEGRNHPSMTLR